jgi:membrane protein implicated in regulation of membrane protease activity
MSTLKGVAGFLLVILLIAVAVGICLAVAAFMWSLFSVAVVIGIVWFLISWLRYSLRTKPKGKPHKASA